MSFLPVYRRCGRVSRCVGGFDSYIIGGVSGAMSSDGGPGIRTVNRSVRVYRGTVVAKGMLVGKSSEAATLWMNGVVSSRVRCYTMLARLVVVRYIVMTRAMLRVLYIIQLRVVGVVPLCRKSSAVLVSLCPSEK